MAAHLPLTGSAQLGRRHRAPGLLAACCAATPTMRPVGVLVNSKSLAYVDAPDNLPGGYAALWLVYTSAVTGR